ncbi:MAG TPA: flagellar basal body P-ring protein FlgI, partial [Tepiditoga sp.]|nr:flagellar basal body P-ring protein FlgI [Tepiditoga sp.]
MNKKIIFIFLIFSVSLISFSARLKDISEFRGARDNQLFGIGIVTGLNGTGDTGRAPSELINNMMKN